MSETPKVYGAISRAMWALAERGIAKGRKQTQAGYMFRGIDDVYEALVGVLCAERLLMLPRVVEAERHEVTTAKGAVMTHLIIRMEYDLVLLDHAVPEYLQVGSVGQILLR